MSYLIDTNAISELLKPQPDKHVVNWFKAVPSESLFISVLSLGEIRKGVEKIPDSKKKEKLRIWLEHELPSWFHERILPIDAEIAERWGRLLAKQKNPIPAIDSLIAATALHVDLSLVTRNISDFKPFSELQVINPWEYK